MNTGIKEFLTKYKEKINNDTDDTQERMSLNKKNRITFSINVTESRGNDFSNYRTDTNITTLDSEDLEYLHNKYSKKVEQEMNDNINKIKQEYKGLV